MLQPMTLLDQLLERYPALQPCRESITNAYTLMERCYAAGGKLLLCGNGGSSADCDHIVGELMKGFHLRRPVEGEGRQALVALGEKGASLADKLQGGLPAVSLTAQTALSSAFCNDVDPAMVYAQQVWVLGKAGDVLMGISTSGNAQNVAYAAVAAKARGGKVIALTGECGGELGRLADAVIAVPQRETFRVQELHLPVYHALCAMVESRFFA